MSPRGIDSLFVDPGPERQPRLIECALLYIDLLGVSAMTEGEEAQRNLVELDRVLRSSYRNFLEPDSPWPAAVFSDTLVLAAPVIGEDVGAAESATGGLLVQAAWLQLNLALDGFFLRGALTLGLAHLNAGLLFGPALVEAYALEQHQATHPRIVLGKAAADAQLDALHFYSDPASSPQSLLLVVDQDGMLFLDYLGLLVDEPDDLRPGLKAHADIVRQKLDLYRSDGRRWDKYRWVADYHNAACSRYVPDDEDLRIAVEESDRRFERLPGPTP